VSTRWPRSASARCARTIRSLLPNSAVPAANHSTPTSRWANRVESDGVTDRNANNACNALNGLIVAAVGHAGVVASRNRPSLAVARNWEMGSSSLKAEVNAFDRLHMVLDSNSWCCGAK
jgi:hypothetical protein